MNKLILGLSLCLIIFTAQANIISSLLDHTYLKGNGKFNTTNGLDLGYNGTLTYKNKYLTVELANLISKFAAHPRPNNEVDYSGDVVINQGGSKAEATVDGAVNVNRKSTVFKFNDTGIVESTAATMLNNRNNWTLQAGGVTVQGVHNGNINAGIVTDQKNNQIHLHQFVEGNAAFVGNANFNGSNDVNKFAYTRKSQLGLEEAITMNPFNSTKPSDEPNPNAAYYGQFNAMDTENTRLNSDSSTVYRNGGGLFTGVTFFNGSKDANSTTAKVANGQRAAFMYQNQVYHNGRQVGTTLMKGNFSYAAATKSQLYKNGVLDVTAAQYGKGSEDWVAFPNKGDLSKKSTKSVQEAEEGQEAQKDCDHKKGYINAQWKAGLHYNSAPKNDLSKQDLVESGVFYNISGNDTVTNQPWNIAGNRTSKAEWNVTGGNNVKNIIIDSNTQDDQFLKTIEKSNDKIKGFLREY